MVYLFLGIRYMSNLAPVPDLLASAPISEISFNDSTDVGFYNPQRLNGIADMLFIASEQQKASVKSLHNAIAAHSAKTQLYVSNTEQLFLVDLETALKRIDASFWLKLYEETSLGNFMDTESYKDHKNALRKLDTVPEFSMDNILKQLELFVGEIDEILIKRVSSIFEKLSGEHVTNSAYGFRERMIIDNCSRSYCEHNKNRYLHDLRCVISTLRGYSNMPSTCSTTSILEYCFTYYGKWHMLDGDSMRIKAFRKGTVHIEIDTEIASKLNAILAAKYPNCLPHSGNKKVLFKSTLKPIDIILDHSVRNILRRVNFEHPLKARSDRRNDYYRDTNEYEIRLFCWNEKNDPALVEAVNLLSDLYGQPIQTSTDFIWKLGAHNPKETIRHLIISGTMPDEVSHQFYESTERVQSLVADLLDIKASDDVCEPSAGRGALAKLLPVEQTTCFEINALNCSLLRGLGYAVKQECFLNYANTTSDRYDVMVMNPPYKNGAYWEHLKAAMSLLKPSGRIVAVVPCAVMTKQSELPIGITMTERFRIEEQFKGTSKLHISIITLEKSPVL